ncbi:unnamed protein product [Caenorhabditis brenneri]
MNGTTDEPLTSFAENPTKSVEKDALVESQPQFTHPDEVERATVEESKWWWANGKQNEKMSRYFVYVALTTLFVFLVFLAIFVICYIMSSNTPQVATESPVYTIGVVDQEKENLKAAQAGIILPEIIKKESSEQIGGTEGAIQEIKEGLVGEHSISPDEYEKEYEKEDITHDGDIIHDEGIIHDRLSGEEEITITSVIEPVTETATHSVEDTTTTKKASPKFLHFHESVDGEQENQNCLQLHSLGSPSGVYTTAKDLGYSSYCDMDTTSGGWTVVQRREENTVNFHRQEMMNYKKGFGNLTGDHWIGLDQLVYIAPTNYPPATLRIEIQGETCDWTCSKKFANTWVGEWKVRFSGEEDGYKLHVESAGTGNLTFNGVDPFLGGDGHRFTTVDHDEDQNPGMNCAAFRMFGPWWHPKECSDASLNGYMQKMVEKYEIKDKNQSAKRYFVWAFEGQTMNGYPYIIHVRKSLMLIKPDPILYQHYKK